MRIFRLALAQINPTVGDLEGNRDKILAFLKKAEQQGADLIAFPELSLVGYPPEDLLLKPNFIEDNLNVLEEIALATKETACLVGFVDKTDDIYSGAAILQHGKILGVYHKIFLPNYGVFDEKRYFQAGQEIPVFIINGMNVGISICEDIWYPDGPPTIQAAAGAEILISLNASPYYMGKHILRERMLSTRASDAKAFLAWVNLVGGQDELIFDGQSMIFDPEGEICGKAPMFEEYLLTADLNLEDSFRQRLHDPRRREINLEDLPLGHKVTRRLISEALPKAQKPALIPAPQPEWPQRLKEIYQALVLGVRDYIKKNGFRKVLIGLSGGIDSALTAAIAVDAVGKDNVKTLFLPSRFTLPISREIAFQIAQNLEIELEEIPIDNILTSYLETLKPHFREKNPDATEENLQARIRGNLLMAFSNKFGYLVLTTGNKSEMAVGYATLYGDMAGGFAVLKDVFKTTVFELCLWRNTQGEIFPESVLTRPPSAELKENQTDEQALCPYKILDPILKAYVEEDKSLNEIVFMGYEKTIVEKIIKLVDQSEYKRRQAPPGVKITPRSFGKDRRLPITSGYKIS